MGYDYLTILKLALYLGSAVFVFIKYRKNIVGILSIFWLLTRISRSIYFIETLKNIKNFSNIKNYLNNFSDILSIFDNLLIFILIVIFAFVIVKIKKEKKEQRLLAKTEAILNEAKEKNIIK